MQWGAQGVHCAGVLSEGGFTEGQLTRRRSRSHIRPHLAQQGEDVGWGGFHRGWGARGTRLEGVANEAQVQIAYADLILLNMVGTGGGCLGYTIGAAHGQAHISVEIMGAQAKGCFPPL